MSIAHKNRRQLESIGDYVTRANIDWFALFPEKLAELELIAASNNRSSNLIVYRTRSGNERDHHVIPFSELAALLTHSSLTHSDVNGTIRWNVTLKDHIVRVSHCELSLDVERHFESPLPIELAKQEQLADRPVDIEPPSRVLSTTYRILRDTVISKQLKVEHEFRCQICNLIIELPDGSRYAEAHHLRPLGKPHNGPDIKGNMIVLCPNHHAMCDYGVIELSNSEIRQIEGHTIDQKYIDYHNNRVYHAKK